MVKSREKTTVSFVVSGIVLLVLCLLSLRLGAADMSWHEFFDAVSDVYRKTPGGVIIYSVRLPRMLSGVVAGMGLGISGAVIQALTGNKMASPNLLGVNAGAGFGVILLLYCFPSLFALVPFSALAGAFLSTLFIATVSGKIGMTRGTVILVGLAFSSILSSGISLMSLLDADVLVSYNAFSIGSLSGVMLSDLYIPLALIVASFVVSLVISDKLDILSLGDKVSLSLGVNVPLIRILSMLIASACAAAAVSFAGLLGFVGLMSPHIARVFFPERSRYTIIASAVIGSMLVTLSDLIGRTLFAPSELPAGIFLSLVGAPFFLVLLISGRGKHNA